MYELVIFDLDGTLLNTIGDLAAAGNYALEKMGCPQHEENAYKLFVGNGIPKLIERMLPADCAEDIRARTYDIFMEYYSEHKSDRTVPYEGMRELIHRLHDTGIKCAVNTNKAHEFSTELLKASFGDVFDRIIGFGIGFGAKPDPAAALELCAEFCPDKSKALYVGDSSVDMQTAANAGIDACAVLWGFRTREELSAYNPRHIVKNASELAEVILK
ncbi:MAG: HAD family hydrolase [Oscillospiraceae bacterium]